MIVHLIRDQRHACASVAASRSAVTESPMLKRERPILNGSRNIAVKLGSVDEVAVGPGPLIRELSSLAEVAVAC